MNEKKQKSLKFLQGCMEKVKKATEQDVRFYKEVYNRECVPIEDNLFDKSDLSMTKDIVKDDRID